MSLTKSDGLRPDGGRVHVRGRERLRRVIPRSDKIDQEEKAMKLSKVALLGLASLGAAVLSAGCSSTAATPTRHDSGADAPVVSALDSGRDTAMTIPHDASDAQTTSTDS